LGIVRQPQFLKELLRQKSPCAQLYKLAENLNLAQHKKGRGKAERYGGTIVTMKFQCLLMKMGNRLKDGTQSSRSGHTK